MNHSFKQRLVGAIVLACIALILWPVLFSGPGNVALDTRSQIPPRPVFEKYTVPEPDRVVDVEPVVSQPLTDKPVPDEPQPSPTKAEEVAQPETFSKPGLDDRQLPIAWALQVASFSQQDNAEELVAALKKEGYKAFSRDISTNDGHATRVYVGPSLNKATLDLDRVKIDQIFKVNSMIVRFQQ